MSTDHWRMQLNNYVQRNGLQNFVSWTQPVPSGPRNAPTWTIAVFFNGTEYGRGSSTRLDSAKEIAAELCLKALWSQRGL
ncbi:hypothetical protein BD309DRAFT_946270 [Dichomitus squalens]|uniref:DRBM domain-containing protein n=1 Tax=Dichomitus squalens TaxID=114155 RepID=A0A4Q9N3G0_9APHY|nr:hypothetical protein BD311DRAFT_746164 [Dichomitus squalens]TBU50040.1 hypothetical protein BD309DRAFT_946270 [Dichomitus squalens]TBU62123.1 hypothetical protein BD310DRAFT_919648 [Dichomitus squalens]